MWLKPTDAKFYYGGKKAVEYFNSMITERRKLKAFNNENKYEQQVKELDQKGYTKWSQVIDHGLIDKIKEKLDYCIEKRQNLKVLDEHYAMVQDPFLHFDEAFEIATQDLLFDFATEYFNCLPGIGTFNLRKSFVNSLPPKATQLYHCDRNSIKFFKFFIYLNDVDEPGDGPLTLIKSSNQKRPVYFNQKHRWSDEELKILYGEENITYMTAKKGDLIAASTTCFHKGTKPTTRDRSMLTLNYVVHPELCGGVPWEYEKLFKVKESQYRSLSDGKKPLCDFLEKC